MKTPFFYLFILIFNRCYYAIKRTYIYTLFRGQIVIIILSFDSEKHMKKGVEYQEYEVKALIGKRLNNGSVEYLVHWKGFRKSQASWTNKTYLEEVKDLIQRYDKTHPEQPKNVQHLTT